MIQIPKQLLKKEFRFIKLRPKSKSPMENEWTTSANYEFNDETFSLHLSSNGNYGVVCGYGNLVVIDCDEKKVQEEVEAFLPETFTVRTGRGGTHYYFLCKDLTKPIRLGDDKSSKGSIGDVQSWGKQVVGPNSVHPNGGKYLVIKDVEITEIKASQIKFALRKWIPMERAEKINETEIENIDILKVVDTANLRRRDNEYYGSHPIHGSDGGMNFWVNTAKNCWHCFRHDSGGGPLDWIAIKEGICSCNEFEKNTSSPLRGIKFKRTLKIGEEKYGIEIKKKNIFKDNKTLYWNIAKDITSLFNIKTASDSREIYIYNEGIYEPNGEIIIEEYCRNLLKEEATSHATKEIINHIKAITYINRKELDSPKELICINNGILNIHTKDLIPHSANKIFLAKLNINFKVGAKCELINKFISEIVKEKDKDNLLELFGYCLLRDHPIHRAFMLVGSGSNGKSTLINLLKTFLGIKNCSSVSLQDIENNRFSVANLYNKLANLYPDLSADALKSTGKFKLITGQDVIGAEQKFGKHFIFQNYAKLIFATNTLPRTKDDTDAFWRRWIIINFPNSFKGKEADKKLLEKLTTEEELSGLLNLALEGLNNLINRGEFSKVDTLEETRERYIRMSDSVKAFILDHIEESPEDWVIKKEIYSKYCEYCRNKNYPVISNSTFHQRLAQNLRIEDYKPLIKDKRITAWKGIKFLSLES